MNIYHTRSKIKSKRHQPTKNRETSALKLRKISWLITKKRTLKFCISRKRHIKGAACFFTFQLPSVHGPSGRESIQDKTSRWGHHCTENPEKKAAVKLQLLSSKVLRRLLLSVPFSSPRRWPNTGQNVNVCARDCSVISQLWIGRQERYLAKERTLFFED